jgi:hypothetical protein
MDLIIGPVVKDSLNFSSLTLGGGGRVQCEESAHMQIFFLKGQLGKKGRAAVKRKMTPNLE